MKLVIDIHEKDYQSILNSGQVPYGVVCAIMNGTPLPKGHGDLIDRNELLKNKEKFFSVFEEDIGGHYSVRQKYIDEASIIIEADKEANDG